jgi:hypothetical protein
MTEEASQAQAEPLSVYVLITTMVDQFATVAWQKLGLQPDLLTGRIHKDLPEAKIAIDLATHLAAFLEPRLDDEDKRRIHNLVRDLRLNYVQASRKDDQ